MISNDTNDLPSLSKAETVSAHNPSSLTFKNSNFNWSFSCLEYSNNRRFNSNNMLVDDHVTPFIESNGITTLAHRSMSNVERLRA